MPSFKARLCVFLRRIPRVPNLVVLVVNSTDLQFWLLLVVIFTNPQLLPANQLLNKCHQLLRCHLAMFSLTITKDTGARTVLTDNSTLTLLTTPLTIMVRRLQLILVTMLVIILAVLDTLNLATNSTQFTQLTTRLQSVLLHTTPMITPM